MQYTVSLTETLDRPYPWQWFEGDPWLEHPDDKVAHFAVPELADAGTHGRPMDVRIELQPGSHATSEDDLSAYVTFGPHGRAWAGKKWQLMDVGNQTVATRILSTVVDVLRAYVTDHPQVGRYEFDSKESSRTKLYARMVGRLASGFPHGPWRTETDTSEMDGQTTFVLTNQ